MQIHPIRNEKDHDAALARIATLMSSELNATRGAELDALVTLADAYEEKHFPIEAPTPIAVIEFYLDQKGLTRKDLEPMIGSRARVSEILSGKRSLTLAMIQRLRVQLGVSADLLLPAPQEPKSPVARMAKNRMRLKKRPSTPRLNVSGQKPTNEIRVRKVS